MTNNRILRLPAVMERTGMSRALIYSYIKQGRFPKQVKIGERAAGWIAVEVDSWIKARVAARKKP